MPLLEVVGADGARREVRGAYGAVSSADGAIAYAQGSPDGYVPAQPFPTQIVTYHPDSGETNVLIDAPGPDDSPKRREPLAWAGTDVLGYRVEGEGAGVSLAVWNESGTERVIGRGTLLAVSPDGTRVAFAPVDSLRIDIVDLESFETVATSGQLDPTVLLTPGGTWSGDRLLLPADNHVLEFSIGDGVTLNGRHLVGTNAIATHVIAADTESSTSPFTVWTYVHDPVDRDATSGTDPRPVDRGIYRIDCRTTADCTTVFFNDYSAVAGPVASPTR